jgi:hypothetical protein
MGKAHYVLARKDRAQANFELASAPRGTVLSSETAGNIAGGGLAAVELDDVRKQDTAHWQSPADRTEIRTFDGWVIGVEGRVDGEQHWIRLTSRFDQALAKQFPPAPPAPSGAPAAKPQPDVSKDAQALAEKSAAWEYEVPKYKYDALFKPLDEIAKKP